MGVQVFIVDMSDKATLDLDVRWDGCPQNPEYGHRTQDYEFRTREYSHISQEEARSLLPEDLICKRCGATAKLSQLPAKAKFGTHDDWDAVGVSGSHYFRRRDTGELLWDIVPGMAWDEGRSRYSEDQRTGKPLKEGDLRAPLTNPDGTPAKSYYSWGYREECVRRGVWAPRWHIALPTSTPWRNGYRGDCVWPSYASATNGQNMGNGYTTGWTLNQWDDPTTMTASPSIFFMQGGPGEWHGFLQNGVLA